MGDKNPNKLKKKKKEKAIEATETLVTSETEKGSAKKTDKKK